MMGNNFSNAVIHAVPDWSNPVAQSALIEMPTLRNLTRADAG